MGATCAANDDKTSDKLILPFSDLDNRRPLLGSRAAEGAVIKQRVGLGLLLRTLGHGPGFGPLSGLASENG